MTTPNLIARLREKPTVNLSGNVVDAAKTIRQMMVDRADAAEALEAALAVTEDARRAINALLLVRDGFVIKGGEIDNDMRTALGSLTEWRAGIIGGDR